jgi:hypothetical protein
MDLNMAAQLFEKLVEMCHPSARYLPSLNEEWDQSLYHARELAGRISACREVATASGVSSMAAKLERQVCLENPAC